MVVFKKILGILKNKFVLIPLYIVGFLALGYGIGYATTSLGNKQTIKQVTATNQSSNIPEAKSSPSTLGEAVQNNDGEEEIPQSSNSTTPRSQVNSNSTPQLPPTPTVVECDETAKAQYLGEYNAAYFDISDPGSQYYIADPAQQESARASLYENLYVNRLPAIHCTA